MSIEIALTRGAPVNTVNKTSAFEYPECDGHPGSSPSNWVLTDYLGYRFAKLLHVTNEDIKQKQKNSSIIEPK